MDDSASDDSDGEAEEVHTQRRSLHKRMLLELLLDDEHDADDESTTEKSRRRRRRGDFKPQPRAGAHDGDEEDVVNKLERWLYSPTATYGWMLLYHPNTPDPYTYEGKRFRGLFRLPHELFTEVLSEMQKSPDFPVAAEERTGKVRGRSPQPLPAKLLAALRILASGCDFDDAAREFGLGEPTVRRFFQKFVLWGQRVLYPKHVCWPSGQRLRSNMKIYALLGFPGAVASVDGVHVHWDACPAVMTASHKGKEGYPTRAVNVSVGPTRLIHHVTQSFPGAWNDKTMAKYDEFMQAVHEDKLYGDVRYRLYAADGTEFEETGCWMICDGGYHRWRELQSAYLTSSHTGRRWCKRNESVRKDSERTFGVLKKRYRILKKPILLRKVEHIDAIIRTCAALHNMLLVHDGLASIGELPSDWTEVDACVDDARLARDAESGYVGGRGSLRFDDMPPQTEVPAELVPETDGGHVVLRQRLVTHFEVAWRKKEVRWLQKASQCRPRKKFLFEFEDRPPEEDESETDCGRSDVDDA